MFMIEVDSIILVNTLSLSLSLKYK